MVSWILIVFFIQYTDLNWLLGQDAGVHINSSAENKWTR